MRETYTSLQTKCQNYTRDTSAATLTFFKDELNVSLRFIFAELNSHVTQRSQYTTTVADQQYYHLPPDCMMVEDITITMGGIAYVLEPVDSQDTWDRLNSINIDVGAIPRYFFQRRDDVGIYPKPQDAYTLTMNYTYRLRDMISEDYSTGTVSVTQNSATVTGSGTTFTSDMVGQWFKVTADGIWYRVASYSSATSITLETVYEGATRSGAAYKIGDSPELPPEAHPLIAQRTVSVFYAGYRRDKDLGVYWSNLFWTGDPTNTSRDMLLANGGLLGVKKRYAKRSNSRIIRRGARFGDVLNTKIWATTITS